MIKSPSGSVGKVEKQNEMPCVNIKIMDQQTNEVRQ